LWIHLVMEACHKPRKTIFNGRIVELKQGQLITGRKKLSHETGISEQIIRKWLEIFEINQQITTEKTSAGSCISIVNYKKYQEVNQQTNQQSTNDQPTINQPSTTIQELKNDKELKNLRNTLKESFDFFTKSINDELWQESVMRSCKINNPAHWINEFNDHANATQEHYNTIKDWRRHCVNWIKKEILKDNQNDKSNPKDRIDSIREWGERMAAGGGSQ